MGKKKRHNSLERKGVYKVGLIIEEEFNWIFREQPIADVGIDALVERCIDENPTGQFLALQIKSGEGNVYNSKTKKEYIYYMSDIHYQYWTNLDLPVLLLCYIPQKKKVYWTNVVKNNIIKTREGWKISLPYNNVFNKSNYNKIDRIASKKQNEAFSVGEHNKNKLFNIRHIDLANDSIFLIIQYVNLYTKHLKSATLELQSVKHTQNLVEKELKIQIQLSNVVTVFESYAKRTLNELGIFSITYIKSILAFRLYSISLIGLGSLSEVKDMISKLKRMENSFDDAIESTSYMKTSIENLKRDNKFNSHGSLDKALYAVDKLISELKIAQELANELINGVEDEMSK